MEEMRWGQCWSCRKETFLSPKERDYLGEPPPDWPRFSWHCHECLAHPDPKRTAEPTTDFTLVGVGDVGDGLRILLPLLMIALLLASAVLFFSLVRAVE